jgi:hypothetical protein
VGKKNGGGDTSPHFFIFAVIRKRKLLKGQRVDLSSDGLPTGFLLFDAEA